MFFYEDLVMEYIFINEYKLKLYIYIFYLINKYYNNIFFTLLCIILLFNIIFNKII